MTKYNESLSYEITDDGYDIYLNGSIWIAQHEPFAKLYLPEGTYEENCLAHLNEVENPEQHSEDYLAGYDQAVLDMMGVE